MANANFTTNPPGGSAPTTFHSGPRPQPSGAVPNVGTDGPSGPTVVKTGATQYGGSRMPSANDAPKNVSF